MILLAFLVTFLLIFCYDKCLPPTYAFIYLLNISETKCFVWVFFIFARMHFATPALQYTYMYLKCIWYCNQNDNVFSIYGSCSTAVVCMCIARACLRLLFLVIAIILRRYSMGYSSFNLRKFYTFPYYKIYIFDDYVNAGMCAWHTENKNGIYVFLNVTYFSLISRIVIVKSLFLEKNSFEWWTM